jgi:acyl transferase domain-containing protein
VADDITGSTTGGVASTDIALVGMAGRFPGADDVGELWETIRAGRSGITRFTDDELRAAGVPAGLLADTAYVKAGAVISGIDQFDADFFGISPKEAQILDPQHRLFLEHSWMALEDAGCAPASFTGAIGVFAGCAWSSYLASNLTPAGTASEVGELAVALANEKDCLPLRTAHLLGLSGPAFGVQSNCSTSLVAVCAAACSLASFECDAALAGGAAVSVPHRVGYLYQPGGIAPPDGQCRAFDAAGLGAPLGSGVGVVVLRRLEDALADGDRIYAVLRGWAVNNDAGRKAGFTAPGVDGQASVIAEALAVAGLRPADIDYIEAHGTGTMLGDAAELAALQRVFRGEAVRIGSIKTNIGHLDRAAGVAGLIKVALALQHSEIPATLNLTEPNPQLAAGQADLGVVTERLPWPRSARPRRAGVSAFGIGGTNAHVVLEEAPLAVRPPASGGPELLAWSARSAVAADQATVRLAGYLENTAASLADVASTLQRGRDVFEHRRVLIAESAAAAAVALRQGAALSREDSHTGRPVTFLISGAGEAYAAVAADLYPAEPGFRAGLDQCRDLLATATGADPLAGVLASRQAMTEEAGTTQRKAAEFAVGYALARLVLTWVGAPGMILGQGVGEYIAASLAGVLTLEDALALVIRRAELLEPGLDGEGPSSTGAGRPGFRQAELASWAAGHVALKPPAIPLVCATTGLVITPGQAPGPDHWAGVTAGVSQAALATVLAGKEAALLELGAGDSLISLAREHQDCPPGRRSLLIPALPAADGARPATVLLAEAIGRLWLAGVTVDWPAYRAGRPAGRVSLPAYPFQRKRYWINPPAPGASAPAVAQGPAGAERDARPPGTAPDMAEESGAADQAGEHVQVLAQRWEPAGQCADRSPAPGRYVILPDAGGVGDALAGLLRQAGGDVMIAPDGHALATAVAAAPGPGRPAGQDGSAIICLTALDEDDAAAAVLSVSRILACCAADGAGTTPVIVVTRGGQAVTGAEAVRAAQAAVTVLPIVASQEYLNLASRSIDLDSGFTTPQAAAALAAELGEPRDPVIACRAGHRFRPGYTPAKAGSSVPGDAVRAGGRYLITGGLGTVGLTLAGHLARAGAARVILASRGGPSGDPGDRRTAGVNRLRALGADVATPRADVTDLAAMRGLLRAEHVDGVIHLAAELEPSTFLPLCDLDEATVTRHFRAKVDGARVLAQAIGELPPGHAPRWCMLFSSTSALLGGLTLGSYAAANAALAARVYGAVPASTRWIAAAWDTWPGTLEQAGVRIGAAMAAHAMTETQARAAFDAVLAQGKASVVVAAGGLSDRLPGTSLAAAGAGDAARYPRPDMAQPYAPPLTATERELAEVWSTVLGVEPVGTRDNFFDLRGNSLLALRMLELVKQRFGVVIPTVTLFERPTVHSLAAVLGERIAQAAEPVAASDPAPASAPAAGRRLPSWRLCPQSLAGLDRRLRAAGPWLVLAADARGRALAQRLGYAGAEVATVTPGGSLAADQAGDFTIRPAHHGDLAGLLGSLVVTPRTVVHAFSLADSDPAGELGEASVAALAAALTAAIALPPMELILLTSGAVGVLGPDLEHPEHAAVAAAAARLAGQDRFLGCRHIDVGTGPDLDQVLAGAADRTGLPGSGPLAVRGDQAWVRCDELIPEPSQEPGPPPVLPGGTVLITDGLAAPGRAMARRLASRYRCRLVLTAPAGQPADELVAGLEQLGGTVLALAADSGDETAMRRVMRAALGAFGSIDLVVCAGQDEGAAAASFRALQSVLDGWAGRRILLCPPGAAVLAARVQQARARGAGRWTAVQPDGPVTADGLAEAADSLLVTGPFGHVLVGTRSADL